MSEEFGTWLTAVRVGRLPPVLRAIRSHPPPGVAEERGAHVAWAKCGGPRDEVHRLLDVARSAGLIADRDGRLRLTKLGLQIATQDHQRGGVMIARTLIQGGFLAGQVRLLLESSSSGEGEIVCPRDVALNLAPQLVGLLRRFPAVALDDALHIPAKVAEDLLTDVWALVPLRRPLPDVRKQVGDRGEAFSYQWQRTRASDASKVRWVAQDDETLGYDLEDLSERPSQKIEVKASRGAATRFFLSAHEFDVALAQEGRYEVHFWGEIDLNRPAGDEYEALISRGFPRVFSHFVAAVESGRLTMKPSEFIVTEPELKAEPPPLS